MGFQIVSFQQFLQYEANFLDHDYYQVLEDEVVGKFETGVNKIQDLLVEHNTKDGYNFGPYAALENQIDYVYLQNTSDLDYYEVRHIYHLSENRYILYQNKP